MLMGILMGIGVTLLLWILYRGVKGNPEAYSKENISKSFMTMGILTLFLIGIIWLAVILLK